MKNNKLNIGIVGCGNIAEKYLDQINNYNNIQLIGLTDIEIKRAKTFANLYNCKIYETLDKMLSDVNVDLVVNLTIHNAHVEVIRKILSSGKHVYTEKPLAMSYNDAKRMIELSEKNSLRLSSAPITYMGEMQQTAYKNISDGLLASAKKKLPKHVSLITVPGVFEIPVTLAKNIKKFDGFVALGCVIKGETPHFDLISKAVIEGIMKLSVENKKPIGNGIITCLNREQALARRDKGQEAAVAVLSVLDPDE